MNSRILNKLKQYELIEIEQKNTGQHVEDLPKKAVNKLANGATHHVLNDYFFRNRNIYISKHNRFADYPEHTHEFLEMNYMLTGHCHQIVDGKDIYLDTGDLLLMDVGCYHSIKKLGEDDILINILFRDRSISINVLSDMKRSNSTLYDFLINRASGESNKIKYLIFKNNGTSDIQVTLDEIIEEYYGKKEYSDTILNSYISILLAKLVRNYQVPVDKTNDRQRIIVNILKDISDNYRTINLEYLSKKYGYNKNYLSNLIKQETSNTFSQLLTKQRLITAHNLISSTTLPISDIIETVGMKNKTDFYRKYRKYYLTNPSGDRN